MELTKLWFPNSARGIFYFLMKYYSTRVSKNGNTKEYGSEEWLFLFLFGEEDSSERLRARIWRF